VAIRSREPPTPRSLPGAIPRTTPPATAAPATPRAAYTHATARHHRRGALGGHAAHGQQEGEHGLTSDLPVNAATCHRQGPILYC
jgi:hypothetical protein